MNLSTAVFLISDEVRAIGVTFDQGNHYRTEEKQYVYKTCDQSVCVGDYVIVPVGASDEYKVAIVRSVDADVNYKSDIQYKWVVSRLDLSEYISLKEREQLAIQEVKRIERRSKREQLRKDLVEFGGDEIANVKFLTASNVPNDVQKEDADNANV